MFRISSMLLATLLGGLLVAVTGCGRNNGTPRPSDAVLVDDELLLAPRDGASLQVSDARHWRAELRWAETPRFSDEEILALTGVIFIRDQDGRTPASVTNVELIADMPQHGHGTGNNLPVVRATEGDLGRFTFENVIFTMQGEWRIRIMANVNGHGDVWTTWVHVE